MGLSLAAAPPAVADDPNYPSAEQVQRGKQRVQEKAAAVGRIEAQLTREQDAARQLDIAAAQAAEHYNGAVLKLHRAQQASAAARRRVDDARLALAEANRRKGQLAAATYRMGGDFGRYRAFLYADGLQTLMDQAAILGFLAEERNAILDQSQTASIVASVMDRQAAAALAAQQAAANAVLEAKRRAEAAVAAQQKTVAAVRGRQDALLVELAAARNTSVGLERARERALAAEAARRAARSRGGYLPGGISAGTTAGARRAIEYAQAQLGKPYVWAAEGPDSFDCSGLTMMAWRAGGIGLPHYSVAQYEQVRHLPAGELRPGDLLFWSSISGDPGTIFHVAMYVGAGLMIEAPRTGDVVKVADMYIMGVPDFYGRP